MGCYRNVGFRGGAAKAGLRPIDLGVSQSTVEAHRAKMQARTLSDLMRMVLSVESPSTDHDPL